MIKTKISQFMVDFLSKHYKSKNIINLTSMNDPSDLLIAIVKNRKTDNKLCSKIKKYGELVYYNNLRKSGIDFIVDGKFININISSYENFVNFGYSCKSYILGNKNIFKCKADLMVCGYEFKDEARAMGIIDLNLLKSVFRLYGGFDKLGLRLSDNYRDGRSFIWSPIDNLVRLNLVIFPDLLTIQNEFYTLYKQNHKD